jgi:hypothetical protein
MTHIWFIAILLLGLVYYYEFKQMNAISKIVLSNIADAHYITDESIQTDSIMNQSITISKDPIQNRSKTVISHVLIDNGDHPQQYDHKEALGNSSLSPPIHIDHIYYINMDNRTDKRDFMESWLQPFSKQHSIPYQRISALSGDDDDACKKLEAKEVNTRLIQNCRGKRGLLKSNLNIMDNYNTTGYTLVLEDDHEIKDYKTLLEAANKVPDDWDVIRFDCWNGKNKDLLVDPKEDFPQIEGGFRTITPRGKKRFCGGTHIVLWRGDRLSNLRKIWEHKYSGIDCALADDRIKKLLRTS